MAALLRYVNRVLTAYYFPARHGVADRVGGVDVDTAYAVYYNGTLDFALRTALGVLEPVRWVTPGTLVEYIKENAARIFRKRADLPRVPVYDLLTKFDMGELAERYMLEVTGGGGGRGGGGGLAERGRSRTPEPRSRGAPGPSAAPMDTGAQLRTASA
jgi:hypothetical protein